MKKKTFRGAEKERIPIRAPVKLADLIRQKAARDRRSISSVGTELLAIGLKLDPSSFGIEPTNQS